MNANDPFSCLSRYSFHRCLVLGLSFRRSTVNYSWVSASQAPQHLMFSEPQSHLWWLLFPLNSVIVRCVWFWHVQDGRFTGTFENAYRTMSNDSLDFLPYFFSRLSGTAKPSCKAQWKREEDKADRGRGGKTTSGNGQTWSSESPRGQWKAGENEGKWFEIICGAPNDPLG